MAQRRSWRPKSFVEAPRKGSLVGFAGRRPSSSTFGSKSEWVRSKSSLEALPPDDDPRSMTSQMNIDTSEWAKDLAERYEDSRDGVQNQVGLWRFDTGLIILDYFQMYGMLLLLAAQGGTFPEPLFNATYFTLAANLDFWGLYEHSGYDLDRAQPRPSAVVTDSGAGFSYYQYIGCWTSVPVILFLLQFALERLRKVDDELVWKRRKVQIRKLSFWCAHALLMPLGICYGRSFQCTNSVNQSYGDIRTWQSVVDNDQECFTDSSHLLAISLSTVFGVLYITMLGGYYMRKVSLRVYLPKAAHHEVFLRFKEAEYVANTDHGWADGMFYLFSSYKRKWANYKAWNVAYKLLITVGFSLGKRFENTQALLVCGVMFAQFVVSFRGVYRVRYMNWLMIILNSANTLTALFVVVNVNRDNIVYKDSLGPALAGYNGLALALVLGLLIYLELRSAGKVGDRPVWPMVFDPNSVGDHGLKMQSHLQTTQVENKRYAEQLRVLVAGRNVLAACHRSPAVLQPMHDVLRCLLVANAMARETAPHSDALHYALWDLVDELTDAFNENNGRSVFSLAQKSSTKETARELAAVLPEFSKRLAVRDFDMALVRPEIKSILLKLQVVAAFLGTRKAFPFDPKATTKARMKNRYSLPSVAESTDA